MVSLPALCLRGKFCNLLLVDAADLPSSHFSPTLSHIILGKEDFFRELYKCELSYSVGYMNLLVKRRAHVLLFTLLQIEYT